MGKVSRTFRIDSELSSKLNRIVEAPYTYTWHLERALEAYDPIKKLESEKAKEMAVIKPAKQLAAIPERINLTAWSEWVAAKGKITEAAKAKQWKLLIKYSLNDQQAIIDLSINSGWKGLFDLKGNQAAKEDFITKNTNTDWREGL